MQVFSKEEQAKMKAIILENINNIHKALGMDLIKDINHINLDILRANTETYKHSSVCTYNYILEYITKVIYEYKPK